jgi:hypothetical protein
VESKWFDRLFLAHMGITYWSVPEDDEIRTFIIGKDIRVIEKKD